MTVVKAFRGRNQNSCTVQLGNGCTD